MPSDEQTRDPQPASASGGRTVGAPEGPASASDGRAVGIADEASGQASPELAPAPMPSDAPGNQPATLVAAGERAVGEPIRVSNTLWRSTHEAAYGGGLPPAITHLREVELGNKRDDAPWSGALDIIPTKADYVLDLIRANSLWPLLSGLACCAIEMMSAATSVNDMDRFGMFPFRASPRQADVLIVAGTLTTKMAGPLVRLWEQMPEPKWCVALGDCTCSGGRYKRSYSTIEGIDRVLPVDIYIPGCPPRPEALIYGMMKLQQLILERRGHWAERRIGPTVPAGI
jgi:NADH-quinone oxidoreductase subunit B